MINSEDRPWGNHDYEERSCEFCGEIYYANHGLQRYCPEKFGRKNYCKLEQKKLQSENKLAGMVVKLAKGGIISYEEDPVTMA